MNTLHVEVAKTETSPGEFVTDGFRVTIKATGSELDGLAVYQSSNPLKALVKAAVLTEDPRFAGYAVTFEDGVAGLAGKANLAQRLDAERFMMIRGIALAEPPVDEIVDAMKSTGHGLNPDLGN